jgi:hypothetical protein
MNAELDPPAPLPPFALAVLVVEPPPEALEVLVSDEQAEAPSAAERATAETRASER